MHGHTTRHRRSGSSAPADAVDREPPGAEGHQHQQAAGDGEVLLEVEHLVAVGEVGVEQHRCDDAEYRQGQCGTAGLPADGEREVRRPAPPGSRPAAAAPAPRTAPCRRRPERSLESCSSPRAGTARRAAAARRAPLPHRVLSLRMSSLRASNAKAVQLVLGVPAWASAFCRSSSSSQPCGQSFVSSTTCSRALASSPVCT